MKAANKAAALAESKAEELKTRLTQLESELEKMTRGAVEAAEAKVATERAKVEAAAAAPPAKRRFD